jgi:hypothetical protein
MQCTRLEKAALVPVLAGKSMAGAVPQMAVYSIAAAWSLVALETCRFAA